jgi:hypothetical protein
MNTPQNGVVYLIGPMGRPDQWSEHRRQARAAASALRQAGCTVVVPHLESEGCEAALTEVGWYRHGLGLLRICGSVALFGDFLTSYGSIMEVIKAQEEHKPVIAIFDKNGNFIFREI